MKLEAWKLYIAGIGITQGLLCGDYLIRFMELIPVLNIPTILQQYWNMCNSSNTVLLIKLLIVWSLSLSLSHTHTHAHARTHARTCTRAQTLVHYGDLKCFFIFLHIIFYRVSTLFLRNMCLGSKSCNSVKKNCRTIFKKAFCREKVVVYDPWN